MRYQPIHDRLIVEELDENKRTAGGLFIPAAYSTRKHVSFGTITAVGTGRVNLEGKTVPLIVKVGDVIAFPKQAPAVIPMFDDEGNERAVLMLREADVIAIVHDMPRQSAILDVAGAPLTMMPMSMARADSSYESEDQLRIAEREGWVDADEHVDEPA